MADMQVCFRPGGQGDGKPPSLVGDRSRQRQVYPDRNTNETQTSARSLKSLGHDLGTRNWLARLIHHRALGEMAEGNEFHDQWIGLGARWLIVRLPITDLRPGERAVQAPRSKSRF